MTDRTDRNRVPKGKSAVPPTPPGEPNPAESVAPGAADPGADAVTELLDVTERLDLTERQYGVGPADGPGSDGAADQDVVIIELTPTQLQNDPLLSASDDVFADLVEKLRWAAIGYAVVGLIAAWVFASLLAIGSGNVSAFAWAAGATVLLVVVGAWYLMEALRPFGDADAYLRSKTPYALARLDRPAVVGLTWQIGVWIGSALAVLVVASGALAFTLALVAGPNSWLWLIAVVPLLIAYLAWFALLQYRLIERTRDAVA
jgi:hypothetical protein